MGCAPAHHPGVLVGNLEWESHIGAEYRAQVVVLGDLVGVSIPLEHRHVLAAGDADGPRDHPVDAHDDVHDALVRLLVLDAEPLGAWVGVEEVSPHDGVGRAHGRDLLGGHPLVLDDLPAVLEVLLHGGHGLLVVEEELQAVGVLEIVVEQAVGCVSGSQAVLALAHGGEHATDGLPGHPGTAHVDGAGDAASAHHVARALEASGPHSSVCGGTRLSCPHSPWFRLFCIP